MTRVHFRQELSWHFRERSAKEAPCIPTIYPEDASLRRESRRNASTWISTATKRLSSRERVYIRWARPVVIPCSRHRWLTLHTHVSSAVMTRRDGSWGGHEPATPFRATFRCKFSTGLHVPINERGIISIEEF